MEMIKNERISIRKLKEMSQKMFGNFVKAVVDVDRKIMALDADLHADQEAYLLENGSKQQFLWGINIYPDLPEKDMIEFDSMINLRPSQGNRSRGVEDAKIQEKILKIALDKIER